MNFTKRELRAIMEDSRDFTIKKKAADMLKLSKLDRVYTFFIGPKGEVSKKYATVDEAYAVVEKILGKWSKETASKWYEYEFCDVKYGDVDSYTF